MEVRSSADADAFTTLDGSTIRVLLDSALGGARHQSLAEATLTPGQSTRPHYHAETEEIYFVLEGEGEIEVNRARQRVGPGDAVLIPPGARHQISADDAAGVRFLCCCAPPYRDEDTFFE